MSRFYTERDDLGLPIPFGKGALREHKKTLAMGAFVRAFNRLNPGDMTFREWVDKITNEYLGPEPERHLPQSVQSLEILVEDLTSMLVERGPEAKLLREIFADTDEHPGSGRKIENAVQDL